MIEALNRTKTILVLRHAKSRWDEPETSDFERGLAPRGVKAAKRIGRWLGNLELQPDLILCSAAKRTRETLALVQNQVSFKCEVSFQQSLYLAPPSRIRTVLFRHLKRKNTILIVGHNPGLHGFVLNSLGNQTPQQLAINLPTGGLVILDIANGYSSTSAEFAHLRNFVIPRQLSKSGGLRPVERRKINARS